LSSSKIVSAINRLAEIGSNSDGEEQLSDEDDTNEGDIVALARKTCELLA